MGSNLERERLGNGLAAHVHIIVETALLDILVLIGLGKAVHPAARTVKNPLHSEHEIEVRTDAPSLIVYTDIGLKSCHVCSLLNKPKFTSAMSASCQKCSFPCLLSRDSAFR